MPKTMLAIQIHMVVAAMRSNMLVLTDTAGPEESLCVKTGVDLGTGPGHCYGGQSACGGVGDVADVLSDEFEISAAHEGSL